MPKVWKSVTGRQAGEERVALVLVELRLVVFVKVPSTLALSVLADARAYDLRWPSSLAGVDLVSRSLVHFVVS